MAKRYSFYYKTDLYDLIIDRKKLDIFFFNDTTSRVFLNRINMQFTITIGNGLVIEKLENGNYLLADGLMLEIIPNNFYFKITFLEDNSTIESYGDGSLEFNNNGFLSFNDDDRDLKLIPTIRKRNMELYFRDDLLFTWEKTIVIENNSTIETNFEILNIFPFEDTNIGEYLGINNVYSIVTNENNIPIFNLTVDYNKNNLDNIFYNG